MKKTRKTIACLIWASVRPSFSPANFACAREARPLVFASRTPDTDSVSCIVEFRSASRVWTSLRMPCPHSPTHLPIHANTGRTPTDNKVSRQSMMIMATSVETTMVALDSTVAAVSDSTDCTPPTSFASRDWISPVRVSAKNRRAIPCKCLYNWFRRSRMMRCPTRMLK